MTSLIALSAVQAVLIGVVSALAVLIVAGAARSALRRPRRTPELDIPKGMQPGPSDPDLEKPLLEKLQAWGLALIVLVALWVPAVWLLEPSTNADDTRVQVDDSVERGRLISMPFSEENQLGFDCERCHGPRLTGGQNVYNQRVVTVPNLETVCERLTIDQIVTTIAEGREGTDMPSWSVRFAGAMHDQQINDLLNYLLSIQQVPEERNLCINPPQPGGASPSPASSPSPSPTEG
jgi:mono/diheme cytochrome c family protein